MSVESSKESRLQALRIAVEQIEKQHGKGAIMRLSEGPIAKIDFISTGSISLDAAIGIGGIPRGRVTEIFRAGIVRQDHHLPARHRRGAEKRRHRRIHRHRTCARHCLCKETGGRCQQFAPLPA